MKSSENKLIKTNIKNNNNKNDYKSKNSCNDNELNSLEYAEALKIDNRNYLQYYFSLLKQKHLLIFCFYTYDDYNSKVIKISLFLFSFALYYTINALFFTDSTMNNIYEEHGTFNFIYQIPQILYSTIISSIINIIITYLALTEKRLLKFKKEKTISKEKIHFILKCFIIKYTFYFILDFLFLILFWYYLSCFGAVYKNTQIYLIKDTCISFGLTLSYPFLLNLIPGIFRIPSLKVKNGNQKCLYIFSQIIQLI